MSNVVSIAANQATGFFAKIGEKIGQLYGRIVRVIEPHLKDRNVQIALAVAGVAIVAITVGAIIRHHSNKAASI